MENYILSTNVDFEIETCRKCDISLKCRFKPSRGKGAGKSLYFITPFPTTLLINGIAYARTNKVIYDFVEDFNFSAYYTFLIKCPTKVAPTKTEIENCREYFIDELHKVSPKVIVPVGDVVTSQFLNYKKFKDVVDKPHKYELNGEIVIIYPIYSPRGIDKRFTVQQVYDNSFKRLAKLYKIINPNYIINELF